MKLSVGFGVAGVDATSKYKLSYTMLPPEAGQHSAFPTKFIGEVTPKRPTQPVVVLVDALDEVSGEFEHLGSRELLAAIGRPTQACDLRTHPRWLWEIDRYFHNEEHDCITIANRCVHNRLPGVL